MGTTRDDGSQQSMWVSAADLPRGGGHPFYERLNRILEAAGFDAFAEGRCAPDTATLVETLTTAAEQVEAVLPVGRGSRSVARITR